MAPVMKPPKITVVSTPMTMPIYFGGESRLNMQAAMSPITDAQIKLKTHLKLHFWPIRPPMKQNPKNNEIAMMLSI
jgi:hypothetical protein